MKILTKRESIDLAARGCFGNALPVWRNLDEWRASGYPGAVMIRYNVPGSQFQRDGVLPTEVDRVVRELVQLGADPSLITLIPAGNPAGNPRVFQGEIKRDEHEGYVLYYSTLNRIMREALRLEGKTATGLRALLLVQHYMDPSSYADLQAIWDQWPDAVVEFTVFRKNVGDRPHRNTIFWEVRDY